MKNIALLVTRPRHDVATHYLYYWTQEIISEANRKNCPVVDLGMKKATRNNLISYLKKDQANLVVLNGHGNSSAVYGHDDQELLTTNQDVGFVKGKVLFMRACKAAIELGPKIIASGAESVIGYMRDFIFLHQSDEDSTYLRKPLADDFARPFMECSNQVVLAMIKGHLPREANKVSKKMYRKTLNDMLTSERDSFMLPYLVSNMTAQVCLDQQGTDL